MVYGPEKKNLSSTMGREAIKLPAVPPKLATTRRLRLVTLFALTNISLSYNVETTVRTTSVKRLHTNGSRGNFN
jgi:hypothetical protein